MPASIDELGSEFAARVRGHDWDAVVITHATFTRWPVSPDATATAMAAELRADITNIGDGADAAAR